MTQEIEKAEQGIDVGFNLKPRNLTEAMEYAKLLANSSIVPKQFAGKPGDVLVAVQMGHELGLSPIQALRNIAVINGRATVWGDALLAIVLTSPACEYVHEQTLAEIKGAGKATCRVKRHKDAEQVREFSIEDAKVAGLWGKQGPWQQYPERMLQMRARAFALRDIFPEVLSGMEVREEVEDIHEADVTVIPSPRRREPVQPGAVDAFVKESQVPTVVSSVNNSALPLVVPAGKPPAQGEIWRGALAGVFAHQGKKGPWYSIKTADGGEFTTFDQKQADLAARLDQDKTPAHIVFKLNGKYRNIVELFGCPEDDPLPGEVVVAEPGEGG